MEKSREASSRVTAPDQESAAASEVSKRASRGRAIGSSAVANAARWQFEKTQGKAVQGHIQVGSDSRQSETLGRM